MIKAIELQIGDYVLVSGTPRRVESITKKKIGYHINPQTDKRLHYARLHDVEPIYIDHEILGKCFDYGKDLNHFERRVSIFDITLSVGTIGFCDISVKYVEDGEMFMDWRVLGQLHIVQNALRVFGIEIDWKL